MISARLQLADTLSLMIRGAATRGVSRNLIGELEARSNSSGWVALSPRAEAADQIVESTELAKCNVRAQGQAPNLGAATDYALLAATTITNTVTATAITGNVAEPPGNT